MLLSLLPLSLLLLLSVSAATTDPLFHSCNRTSTVGVAADLNRITTMLADTAPSIGFGIASIGENRSRTYGLALCRGDVDRSACRACIRSAGASIRQLCPNKKEAIVYFDNCLLRYSDAEFFGEVDDGHWFFLQSETRAAAAGAEVEVAEAMEWLRRKAYLSPLMFATRAEGGLYAVAQCSRDLSGGDCNRCLKKAAAGLAGCCGGRTGGRVVGGSCYVRFESYPFFHA